MVVKLSSKGQLVIPKALRQALKLHAGAEFGVRIIEGSIVLDPIVISPLDALYGKYADCDLLTDLETEHRSEVHDDSRIHA